MVGMRSIVLPRGPPVLNEDDIKFRFASFLSTDVPNVIDTWIWDWLATLLQSHDVVASGLKRFDKKRATIPVTVWRIHRYGSMIIKISKQSPKVQPDP